MPDNKAIFCDLIIQGKILQNLKGTDAELVKRLHASADKTHELDEQIKPLKTQLQTLIGQRAEASREGLWLLDVLYAQHGEAHAEAVQKARDESKGKVAADAPEKVKKAAGKVIKKRLR